MLYIIFASLFALIFLIGLGIVLATSNPEDSRGFPIKSVGAVIAGIGFTLLVASTVLSSMTIVEGRTVSVQTSFGRYDGVVHSGLNWTAPWSDFESFSTTLQPLDLNDFDGSKGDAVVVSFSAPRAADAAKDAKVLAGGGNGTISAVVNWRMSDSGDLDTGAKALWEKYRTFDAASSQLVKAKAMDTISDVANDLPANEATVNQTAIGEQAKARLEPLLRPYGIVVQDVSIRRIILDPATAASLQKIVDAINKTAAATEEAKAATIQNGILEARSKAGALEQKANERYCLDIVNSWDAAKNGALPATFNCGIGAQQSGVLVQAK
jgi:regulator of protease activity HflC (stomatin/prohibitin superfamily)